MASGPPNDPLLVLAGLYTPALLVRLTSLPILRGSGWRLELSEDQGSTWTSLEPGTPGHATPALAISTGASLISQWQQSRTQAQEAEVSHFFLSGRLERRKILVLDESQKPIQVDGYAAKAEDGTWIEDVSPSESIRKAKEHIPPQAPKSTRQQQQSQQQQSSTK